MTPPQSQPSPLPPQLYTYGTALAAVLMLAGLFGPPELAPYAVAGLAAVPVAAALWVAASSWRRDRPLALAAFLALLGLVAIFFGRSFFSR